MHIMAIDIESKIIVQIICVPKCLRVVIWNPESALSARKSIYVVIWDHCRVELQKLVFEDNFLTICTEEDLTRDGARDLKLKRRRIGPLKIEITRGSC